MIKTKLIKNSKDNDSIKNIFLPLSIHHISTNNNNNSSKIKEKSSINNKSSEINLKFDNNSIIHKKMVYPKNLVSPANANNKKSRNISLSLSGNTNNLFNYYYSYTSPNVYRQILAKYKKDKDYNSQRNYNNNELKYSFFNENLKTSCIINNFNEKEIKKNYQIFPIVKKISLRNIFCDEKYHNEQIKDLIDNKKEKETENNKIEIRKTNEKEKKVILTKFKSNNNKTKNIQNNIKKSESFNKKIDPKKSLNVKEKNNSSTNEIKDINKKNINKINFNSLNKNNNIRIIKNNTSDKTYFLQRITPRRKKNNNDDIINLLNLDQ